MNGVKYRPSTWRVYENIYLWLELSALIIFCWVNRLSKNKMYKRYVGLYIGSLWRNRLARSAVNRKVGGSSPPRDAKAFCGASEL